MSKRLNKARQVMKEKHIDVLILYNLEHEYENPNVYYLTGFFGIGVFVLRQKGKPYLFVPKMYLEQAKGVKGVAVRILKKDFYTALTRMFSSFRRTPVVGLDYFTTTLVLQKKLQKAVKRKIKVLDVYEALSSLRTVKDESEVQCIAKACSISDAIYAKFVKIFSKKRFPNESDVKTFFLSETYRAGCDKSFDPIIASGKNASQPHYLACNSPVKDGFLLIDFGVRYKGYDSDTTRMFYVGKPSAKEKELYALVLSCQTESLAFVEKNRNCGDIEKFSRKKLGKYEKLFIHGLGHGVGIKIHELPNLLPGSKDVIGENMVFTVEPGIYLPGKLGIRIEDTCVLKKGKVLRLTKFSKELKCL